VNWIKQHQNKFLLAGIATLFLIFAYFLLYRLGVHPYIDWDESIYAQVAKEAFVNHKFFNLTYFGAHWYEKPPLVMWLISASYAVGGINEWAARLPSAIAALATVLLSLRWVYELRKSYTAVFFTMAAYFIMFPFITASYFINFDTIVGVFILTALYSWWKAYSGAGTKDSAKWFLVWGIALGLGVMTKNIVGFLPLVPIGLTVLFDRNFKFFKNKFFWYGVLALVLIAAPWHIYQSFIAGKAFWDNYLLYHVVQRATTNLEGNGAPFSYFFQLVFTKYYLALAIFGSGVLISVWLAIKDRGIRFVLVSAASIFLLFSIATTKLPSYIVVVLPLIVMLSGLSLAKIVNYIPRVWMRVLVAIVLAASFVYTGYAFNTYKLALGEYTEEYIYNKKVGEFLKDYKPGVPVFVNQNYKGLAIGYYANRNTIPTNDAQILGNATERVFHQRTEEVFLGKDAQGNEYIVIKRM
jgi:4-amino-4-deoxy-L-arabinose transferase-like glycosyltransferase